MTFNRRHVVQGLGAGLGSTALAGCAPQIEVTKYSGNAEVIILGAGLAGLRVAQILSEAGKEVIVLEANDRIGGRVYTRRHADGLLEAGGARIRQTDKRLQSLAAAQGLILEPAAALPEKMALWAQGQGLLLGSDETASFITEHSAGFQPRDTDLQISGGAQRLPEGMANNLLNWPILKTYIKSISVADKEVLAADHTGRIWRGQNMVCTLPYGALRHLHIDADMAAAQKMTITRLPYVQNLQIHFRAKIRFWEKDGLPADMWSDGPVGHIIANRDASGDLTGLFKGSLYGDDLNALYKGGAKGLRQRFRAELARLRPSTYANIEILDVVDWTEANRAAGGAYAGASSADLSDRINPIGDPVGGLHFAGSHLGLTHNGMEGALESAERAAAEILA